MPNKPNIPKELLAKMRESRDGYYEFDTSAPGPFCLPLLDKLESVDLGSDPDRIILKFRDHQEGKAFYIPFQVQILSDLIERLSIWESKLSPNKVQ